MKKIIFFILLVGCSSNNLSNNMKNEVLDFDKDLTFDEFKALLEKYNNISGYPDID